MYKYSMLIFLSSLLPYSGRSQQSNPSVHISYFAAIPKVIDGCAGTYTYDTTLLKKEKYILITNLQELAMIRVDGKTISLRKVSESLPAKHTFRYVYKGKGYIVIVVVKNIKDTGDEESYETGTMEIKFGAVDITYKIHGIAGC